MHTAKIQLKSMADIKDFVNRATREKFDIDVVCGRYIINAKSIMGLFSLDLAQELTVCLRCEDGEGEGFLQGIEKYLV